MKHGGGARYANAGVAVRVDYKEVSALIRIGAIYLYYIDSGSRILSDTKGSIGGIEGGDIESLAEVNAAPFGESADSAERNRAAVYRKPFSTGIALNLKCSSSTHRST